MDETQKNSYMAAGIFAFIGFIFLYVGLSEKPINVLVVIIGGILGGTGIAAFKYPQIGEVLFHWMEKQGKSSSVKQSQHKPKNSPQTYTGKGDVHITQNFYGKDSERK